MLLDEITQLAIDDKQSLSVLLRKCLLLSHNLKNQSLKDWVNNELNGYGSTGEVPDYRKLSVGAKGNFAGPFGAALKNYPIAPASLEKDHRHFAERLLLTQPVSAYEPASTHSIGQMSYEWPANLCLFYQDKLYDGYVLVNAWQSVPESALRAILDTIRNRVLKMTLEIKEEFGDDTDLQKLDSSTALKVQETISQTIFVGPNYMATNNAQMNISNSTTVTAISAQNRNELDRVLSNSGLLPPDLQELTEAMKEDNNTLGERVNDWISRTAPKVLAGGVKIATQIAQSLLTDWVRQYFGPG